jgi:aryl-alcohol dehydrogenase-like predicted oxidoreductase
MIEQRPLGRAGIQVSRLSLGTMTFGAQTDEPTARSMIDLALERGVNFVDTANVYNGGITEEILGRIFAGRRDRIVLASKVGIRNDQLLGEAGLSRSAIMTAIENSLKRLKTDYLDLYYFHQPDYSVPLEQSLAVMDELVQSGKVRFFAASNYASWQLCRMLWLADKDKWPPVVATQPMYNLLARRIEQELLPLAADQQLAVIPYNPLAGGLLTGKHEMAAPIAGSRFDRMPFYRDRYWNAENFAAVQRLTQIARDAGRSLPQLPLGWLAQQPTVTSIILGASRLDQLEENLAAIEKGLLPEQALAACDEVWATLRGISPTYNR